MNSNSNQVIQQGCIKRLVKDVTDIYKNPLDDNGIYYIHDENDMLKGYAMIIGQKDTVYEHGFFFFSFLYPTNYPYSPPKVNFKSNNGIVRAHPNLYRNEKVCLSVLNTWKGEGWTSCQTIRSILLTLASVLDNNPLLHEPGITKENKECTKYNEVIQYFSLRFAFLKISEDTYPLQEFILFKHTIENYKKKHMKTIQKQVSDLAVKIPSKHVYFSLYNFKYDLDYTHLNNLLLKTTTQNKSF